MADSRRDVTRHPRNAAGDFYVEHDCCTLCGVPWSIAPELFDHNNAGCWVSRQPQLREEQARIIEVIATQELNCIRYGGRDPAVLNGLANAMGLQQADYASTLEPKAVYEIDGARFHSLDEFYDEVSAVLAPGASWGRSLDAFNDILRGGFGTPEGGFEIRWKNHAMSRSRLGHRETARQLRQMLRRSHRSHRPRLLGRLLLAHLRLGPTIFDELEEIIRAHGAGGSEASDGVRLLLD